MRITFGKTRLACTFLVNSCDFITENWQFEDIQYVSRLVKYKEKSSDISCLLDEGVVKICKKGMAFLEFLVKIDFAYKRNTPNFCYVTSHSAYDATSTESNGVKIDGFLYPNFM